MSTLSQELCLAELHLARLRRAEERKRLRKPCPSSGHEWRSKQCMAAASGHQQFRDRVREISGVDLPHAGYRVYQCLVCAQWGLQDYCGGEMFVIDEQAAKALL